MAKNFRIANEVTRDASGRFAERYKQPPPAEILRKAASGDEDVPQLLQDKRNRAMDHDTPGGQPGVGQNPWPPAKGPARPPFRFGG